MIMTTRHIDESILSLSYNDVDLEITTGDKILGINIDANLTWREHFYIVCKKVSVYVWLLSKICSYLSYEHKVKFCNAYIQLHFNYCIVIWGNSSTYNLSRVTKLQKRAIKIILGNEYLGFENAKMRLNILSFEQSVFVNKAKFMTKVANL